MVNKIIAAWLLVLILGCNVNTKPKENTVVKTADTVTGSWLLFDIAPDGIKTRLNDSMIVDASLRRIPDEEMISFYPDGMLTDAVASGNFDTGRWQYNADKTEIMVFLRNKQNKVRFSQEVVKGKQVLNFVDAKTHMRARFMRYGESLADFKSDPFYRDNNLWRMRPSRSETDKELQQRLGNYFKHILAIFKAAQLRKQDLVTFEFSGGILKIYNGGIGINKPDNIPVKWSLGFFNEKDEDRLYTIFHDYLFRSSYRGKGTGNWIIDDHAILLNMYTDLQNGKFDKPLKE